MSGTTLIAIRDHVQGLVTTLVYGREHKDPVAKAFKAIDPLLMQLQHHEEFRGCLRLSDLTPTHFRLLIGLHLSILADLTAGQRLDPDNVTMRSVDWLLVGFVRCLEGRLEGSVSCLTITRVSEIHVIYDATTHAEGVIRARVAAPAGGKPGLRVIVDNDKA